MGLRGFGLAACAALVLTLGCSGDDDAGTGGGGGLQIDPIDFVPVAKSCTYECPVNCPESEQTYACQNLGDWKKIPHAESCAKWSGKYPTVTEGTCSVSTPSGDAAKYAGPDPDQPGRVILPDGRRISPAGSHWVFDEADLPGGSTSGLVLLPGGTHAAVVDTGNGPHAVRLLSTTGAGGSPVLAYVKFEQDITLNSGMAFVAPDTLYVPSANGLVYALTVDTNAGTLTRDDTRAITLPAVTNGDAQPDGWYASSVAASPDGKRLVVTPVVEDALLVYDVDAASPTAGQLLGQVDLGAHETFGAYFDPADTTGARVFVTVWGAARVLEVDLSNPAAPSLTNTFDTSKDPQGLAFIDTQWLVAGGDLGDSLSIVDRLGGIVTEVAVDVNEQLHGLEPSALAYDASAKRLYAALAGMNAVFAYGVDTAASPPTLSPLGRIPTGFWPSGIAIQPDGSLVITNLRGAGTGPNAKHFDVDQGEISDLIRGSVQVVPAPTPAELAAGEADVASNNAVSMLAGAPVVSCPGENDFPIPATNDAPSPHIDHVFFILRENKNFDGLFGDLPGVEGRADLTLKVGAGEMDAIWTNLRSLARTFTVSDNYYTSAVQSTQGHVWATYGRTNDFNERTWAVSGGGHDARAVPGGGVLDVGRPVEGSLFDWLGKNGIQYDILGEIVGTPDDVPTEHNPIDPTYPGGPFQNIGYNDLEKACYVAARTRVLCDTGELSYITLPNDHTFGISPNRATPEVYCAVNDEATGMVVDAISHSPLWATSLIVITQDDPLQGGEHIDSHRTPLVLVSPWVKRGYVSKTHIDTSSLHKLYAHVFGKPYSNLPVKNALLPLDAFTSTPDYTPFTYTPRSIPLACGDTATDAEALMTESWDFSEVDEQQGLSSQVVRWMRGKQLKELTPEQRTQALRRIEALRSGRSPEKPHGGRQVHDDDD